MNLMWALILLTSSGGVGHVYFYDEASCAQAEREWSPSVTRAQCLPMKAITPIDQTGRPVIPGVKPKVSP